MNTQEKIKIVHNFIANKEIPGIYMFYLDKMDRTVPGKSKHLSVPIKNIQEVIVILLDSDLTHSIEEISDKVIKEAAWQKISQDDTGIFLVIG